MYVQSVRNREEFIKAVQKHRKPVRVNERAVALPVREQGGVVVRPALERQYVVDVTDSLQGEMRLIFTEHLIVRDHQFPFDTSLLVELERLKLAVIPTGLISGAA